MRHNVKRCGFWLTMVCGVGVLSISTSAAPTQLVDERPVEITRISPDIILVDFGKVAYGNIRLIPAVNATGDITLHFGEDFLNGRVNRTPKGTVRYKKTTVALSEGHPVVAAPSADKRNTEQASKRNPPAILTPSEWGVVLPFRWVEVEGWVGELKPEQIVRQSAYASTWNDEAASFECSDDMLNQIWNLCSYSIKATTFAGVYVDGDRERIPYEADAYLNQLSHYYTDDDKVMARDTINYMLLEGIGTWPTEWAPHLVFMVYADWMHTGDLGWMSGRYRALKSNLNRHRLGDDGLIYSSEMDIKRTDIVDWPKAERDGYVFTERNTVVNAFYLRSIELMAKMARAIGFEEEAKQYEADYNTSYAAFQNTFFDAEKGLYQDGVGTDHISSHANLFPLAFGLVPEQHRKAVAEWLADRGMRCSVYAAQYLMEGLFENGVDAKALSLMTADGDRSWRHMVDNGATITWEAWDLKYKPNQDWNHAWGAAPANLLPRYVLGVEPLVPGWKVARISPSCGGLKSARGNVPTRLGPILVGWEEGKIFRMELQLPEGMSAQVDLPKVGESSKVLLNGKPVETSEKGNRLFLNEQIVGKVVIETK